jgi:hypothetical protein
VSTTARGEVAARISRDGRTVQVLEQAAWRRGTAGEGSARRRAKLLRIARRIEDERPRGLSWVWLALVSPAASSPSPSIKVNKLVCHADNGCCESCRCRFLAGWLGLQ